MKRSAFEADRRRPSRLFAYRRSAALAVALMTSLSACETILGLDDATAIPPAGVADGGPDAPASPDAGRDADAEAEASSSLAVRAAKPIMIFRDGSAIAELELTRDQAANGPVDVTLTGLPTGVTADPLVVPAGATKASLNVRANASAPFGVVLAELRASHTSTGVVATAPAAVVVRDLPGKPDTSFVDGGVAATMELTGAVALPDGAVLVAGKLLAGTKNNAVVRLRVDGSLDPAFGASGRAEANEGSQRPDVAVDGAGNIFVSGLQGQNPPLKFYVARFDANGKRDPKFSGNGAFEALYGSGLVVHGGNAYISAIGLAGSPSLYIGRLTSAGFDPTYGTAGFRDTSAVLFQPRLEATLSDGRFLVVAQDLNDNSAPVVRLSASAAFDSSFGNDDAGAFRAPGAGLPHRLAVLSDGRIAVTGVWDGTAGTVNGQLVAVATPNGKVDPTFAVTPASGFPTMIAVDAEDRIVVVGYGPRPLGSSTYKVFLQRFTSRGQADGFFNGGNAVIGTRVLDPGELVTGAVIDPYLRLVVVTTKSLTRYWL